MSCNVSTALFNKSNKAVASPVRSAPLPRSLRRCAACLRPLWASPASVSLCRCCGLMEVFRIDEVAAAVRDAIARGAIGFDAVKHLVLCRIERRRPRLDMTIYPYLPKRRSRLSFGAGLDADQRRGPRFPIDKIKSLESLVRRLRGQSSISIHTQISQRGIALV